MVKIGDKIKTTEGYYVTVVEYESARKVLVRFDDNSLVQTSNGNLKKGVLKHKNHKSVCGIGFVGYGKYTNNNNTKAYDVWQSMLKRCYDEKYQKLQPTYLGCSVDFEWHNFQNFCVWFLDNYIIGFHLDKDLLVSGNKIYSKNNCCFLPQEINNALRIKHNKNSKLPFGIRLHGNKFELRNSFGVKTIVEYYTELSCALISLKKIKEQNIKNLAHLYDHILTKREYDSLIKWNFEINNYGQ